MVVRNGPSGEWFDVGFDFEDSNGQSISAAEIQLALRRGESYLARGSRTVLIDSEAVAAMQDVFSDCASSEASTPGCFRLASVYAPFVKESLDHGFEYANVRGEKPEFTKRPSDYIREQVWACTFFEEFATTRYLDEIGADRVMFETDYPHPVCLYGTQVREKIDAAFGDLAADVRERVLFSNAAELYGVGAPDRVWEGGTA